MDMAPLRSHYLTYMTKFSMQVLILVMLPKSCNAQQAQAPTATPASASTPAPALAPPFVNVTQVLALAGDYSTFVNLMIETKVDRIFQNNANQTQTGITIFAPTNEAFTTKLASTLLKNLTEQQKVSLVEYHALNSWLPLASLQQADQNLTTTLATYNNGGGRYNSSLMQIYNFPCAAPQHCHAPLSAAGWQGAANIPPPAGSSPPHLARYTVTKAQSIEHFVMEQKGKLL